MTIFTTILTVLLPIAMLFTLVTVLYSVFSSASRQKHQAKTQQQDTSNPPEPSQHQDAPQTYQDVAYREGLRNNKLMRWRILLQFFAIGLFVLIMLTGRGS